MSDMPNGNPPGQNNLDAGVERYVDVKNDPSAGTPKTDPKEQETMAQGKPLEAEGTPATEPGEDDPSNNPAPKKEPEVEAKNDNKRK